MDDIGSWIKIEEWCSKSSQLFLKKLSRNDCGWADGPENGHQNGAYIPVEVQKSGFFPELKNVNKIKKHILETTIDIIWPDTGEFSNSRLAHYSNKGSEMHFTRVPKDQFSSLTPASFLLGGKLISSVSAANYWFIVIDSASEEAEILESILNLDADFHYGIYEAKQVKKTSSNEAENLIDLILDHIKKNTLNEFINGVSTLPSPQNLAKEAQKIYLEKNGYSSLNPYEIEAPGDAIMQISRDIEYILYKQAELKHRAAEVINIVLSDKNPVIAIVKEFAKLDAIFLSASQHRKSRAGLSFEQHIGQVLKDGKIKFEAQVVTGGRRPDFVLPDKEKFVSKSRKYGDALVISAKTTLRERWKQITHEKLNCDIFLATVDDRVSAEAIEDMSKKGIQLIVPESLKKSKKTHYDGKSNVMTFRDFFDDMKIKKARIFE